MTRVRAIFFDIGDTLVFDDPPLQERLQAVLRASGIVFDASRWPSAYRAAEAVALRRYLDAGSWDDADGRRDVLATLLCGLNIAPHDAAGLPAALASMSFTRRVSPGALALLAELRARGFVLGAISDWEDSLPAVLEDLGLRSFFHALAVSSIVGVTKPNLRLFRDALQQVPCAPSETLHVGDWYELDVRGARSVGMNALLFDHAGRCPDADCPRVRTFGELSDWLLSLSAAAPSPASPTLSCEAGEGAANAPKPSRNPSCKAR